MAEVFLLRIFDLRAVLEQVQEVAKLINGLLRASAGKRAKKYSSLVNC